MGVMSCSRSGCSSIMCDTYIDNVGYICNECQSEFKEYLKIENLDPKTDKEIEKELKYFKKVQKGTYTEGNPISVDDYFNRFNRHKDY